MADFCVTDEQLNEVAAGKRNFTPVEKAWALEHHDFLFEFVSTQGGGNKLSDAELAREVFDGAYDYVCCTGL
ncbi:hypothetical protein [Alteromonas antoniana]|uniref:hypothetical protein n=1 Tax=Alteromonas antoniana TaxID=2803813 RepID=UPI001C453BC8|nr:hypothetical protein [Alteromonas antoniana]